MGDAGETAKSLCRVRGRRPRTSEAAGGSSHDVSKPAEQALFEQTVIKRQKGGAIQLIFTKEFPNGKYKLMRSSKPYVNPEVTELSRLSVKATGMKR